MFYSGGIDGKLNIWGLNSEKIKKLYELEEAHQVKLKTSCLFLYFKIFLQNSINSIVESSYNNFNFIITGSKDEMVKVWKPGEEIAGVLSEIN